MPTVRGSRIGFINNSSTATLALPAGAAAGDYCLLFTQHAELADPASVPSWHAIDNQEINGIAGAAFETVLTAHDISVGSVTVGFGDNYNRASATALSRSSPLSARPPVAAPSSPA
jgi:hypothetical protein